MIKISVIIPIYNTEKFLKKCLDSIVNQSLKEIEIIAINDGSTDESLTILQEYKEKNSNLKIINKKNGGLSSARNAGIKLVSGEYIIHIDSDDWIEQNYFKDMYERAMKDNLDIVVSDIYWDYDNGKIEYKKDLDLEDNQILTGEKYLELFLKGKIYPSVWNKMYKTKLYKKYKIFHPQGISLGEDLATTPLLAKNAKKIGKVNKAYLHYIQNEKSITNSNPTKKIYELISAFDILENKLKLQKEKLKLLNSLRIVHLGIIVFNKNYNIDDNFYKNGLKYYCELFEKEFDSINYNKKIEIYSKALKLFPNIIILKVIWYLNKVGVSIKNIRKLK